MAKKKQRRSKNEIAALAKKATRAISYIVLGVGLGGPAIVGAKRAFDAGNPAGAPAEVIYEYTGLQSDGNMNWQKTQVSLLQIGLTVLISKTLRWAAK